METETITVKKVTEESVAKACADLVKEGIKPSVDAVRLRLSTSPNKVARWVKKWKDSQPTVAPEEITLDPAIARLIAQQMAAYAADVLRAAEARAAEAEENVQCLTDAGQLLELQVTELQAALESCGSQVQQLVGQLAERAQEMETMRSESRASVQASEFTAASERASAEALRQELVRAQIRNESLAGLENALADTQHQLKRANDAVAGAQQSAAVSDARALAASERAQQAEARETALRTEVAQLRDQVARGHTSTQDLAATLAKVSGDLAAAVERKEPVKQAADAIGGLLQVRGTEAAAFRPADTIEQQTFSK